MSILANRTEYRALLIIAQMVREFERLDKLEMTKLDDFDAKLAYGLLSRIVESNGYKVNFNRKSEEIITKN